MKLWSLRQLNPAQARYPKPAWTRQLNLTQTRHLRPTSIRQLNLAPTWHLKPGQTRQLSLALDRPPKSASIGQLNLASNRPPKPAPTRQPNPAQARQLNPAPSTAPVEPSGRLQVLSGFGQRQQWYCHQVSFWFSQLLHRTEFCWRRNLMRSLSVKVTHWLPNLRTPTAPLLLLLPLLWRTPTTRTTQKTASPGGRRKRGTSSDASSLGGRGPFALADDVAEWRSELWRFCSENTWELAFKSFAIKPL